ncbi:hypothetical protein LUZ60_003103 [Juncus effusus]|nr:hypothetical protein LUZ60_003103 [Juncus effusus]
MFLRQKASDLPCNEPTCQRDGLRIIRYRPGVNGNKQGGRVSGDIKGERACGFTERKKKKEGRRGGIDFFSCEVFWKSNSGLSADNLVLLSERKNSPINVTEFNNLQGTMGDHMAINVDPEGKGVNEEESPLINIAECRICQEEDQIKNLESPCACTGSLKYAHRACVQRWCDEKGDILCEICHNSYKHGYTAPPRSDETSIDIRFLAVSASEDQILGSDYEEEYPDNSPAASFFRTAAFIFMCLLLLKPALFINDEDEDASTVFALFLLRAAGFLLPFYIMAWAINIIQRRRQAQEAEAMAATEVAFILQSGQSNGLHFTIAPDSPATPQGEPST